jgi:hypothetical protein
MAYGVKGKKRMKVTNYGSEPMTDRDYAYEQLNYKQELAYDYLRKKGFTHKKSLRLAKEIN